jgi:hypothetical protein
MAARWIAAIGAVVTWAALALQFGLIVDRSAGEGAGFGFAV